jgi:hypothetical protein
MSATAADAPEKIRHPEEMTLPSRERIEHVLPLLTDDGKESFLKEVLDALADAKENGNLAHVDHVVEAWYRTLLFKMDPDHEERWVRAQEVIKRSPESLDRLGVRAALNLPAG